MLKVWPDFSLLHTVKMRGDRSREELLTESNLKLMIWGTLSLFLTEALRNLLGVRNFWLGNCAAGKEPE